MSDIGEDAKELAYEDNVVVQNAFVLILVTIKLGDLPETVKHALHDPVVRSIHIASDFETIGTAELTLNT